MNKRKVFQRKLAYGIAIAMLLYPLLLLSRPATVFDPKGGLLSEMRSAGGLSQADLGEIDPASATMKLATLGLRGLAVNLLWGKADEYKKKEDWSNLTSTLEQLALLQPNFITFWKYQSWNVSYNVSVQFDDYRDRYYYVRRGMEFLQEGIEKNSENRDIPQLLWDLGWFVGQKIGRADEVVQYRRLFKADDAFHGDDPPRGSEERDNWRVSKLEYENAIAAVDDRHKSLGKKSEQMFYASPSKSQMSYAEATGNEGKFELGRAAWKVAADGWKRFGDLWITHSTGRRLQLGHEQQVADQIALKEKELDSLSPGLRSKLLEERRSTLSAKQRAAIDKPDNERSRDDWNQAYEAKELLLVTDQDIVDRILEKNPQLRKQAGSLGSEIANLRVDLIYTQRYKDMANYDYWKLRAEFEQSDEAVKARQKMYLAKKESADGQSPIEARKLYEEGFALWRQVLDQFPTLRDREGTTGDDLMVFILKYRKVLDSQEEPIPDDFPLWDIIEDFDTEQEFVEEIRQRKLRVNNETSGVEPPQAKDPEAASQDDSESGSPKELTDPTGKSPLS